MLDDRKNNLCAGSRFLALPQSPKADSISKTPQIP